VGAAGGGGCGRGGGGGGGGGGERGKARGGCGAPRAGTTGSSAVGKLCVVPAGALPVPVSDGAYSTFIAQVRWAPALLGSFVWYRPGALPVPVSESA
jgi:hypothetical protein